MKLYRLTIVVLLLLGFVGCNNTVPPYKPLPQPPQQHSAVPVR